MMIEIRGLPQKFIALSYAHFVIEMERTQAKVTLQQLDEAFRFFERGGVQITALPEHECV